jgi:hypothetical protein
MEEHIERSNLIDNGGRRAGADRRQFVYTSYIPERRVNKDRRSGLDRRREPRMK